MLRAQTQNFNFERDLIIQQLYLNLTVLYNPNSETTKKGEFVICEGRGFTDQYNGHMTMCQSVQLAIVGGSALAITAFAITCLARYVRVPCEDRDIQDILARPWITCCQCTAAIGTTIALTGLAARFYLSNNV